MIFTKDLLLKGLAGLALCTGTAALGVHYMGGFSSLFGEVKVTEKGLGLPEGCRFPAAGATESTTCTLTTQNVDAIKFDGKNSTTITGSSGTQSATLQISKDRDFPQGYKFTLTPTSGTTLTINRTDENGGNIVIKAGKSADFKVKKTNDGFSLEEAFTLNTLTNKLADFTCTNGTVCDFGTTTAISIKQGEHKESKTKSTSQTSTQGKIKVYSREEGYNKGFKFVVEEGDIDLTGTSGNNITKLEQFETYEIKKEGEEWILFRKSKASEEIKKALNLPRSDCTMPEGSTSKTECTSLNADKLKAIKFEGKGDGEVTIAESDSAAIKLKISKTTTTNKTDFPYGFKFVLESNKDITISQGTNTAITIKKGTNTEFKIKKVGEGRNISLTLEKAWTFDVLKTKVGLTNCQEENGVKKCDFGSSSINVYASESSFVKGASLANGSTGKKMTCEEGVEGYSQGFKFTSAEDLTLEGGTGLSGGTPLNQISSSSSASYEIKEIDGV